VSDGQRKSLTQQQLEQVQAICNRYERAWRQGQATSIEAAAAGVELVVRPALLQQLAELDIQCRVARGEAINLNVFLMRWPDLDRDALEEAVDQARASGETSPGIADSAIGTPDSVAARPLPCSVDEFLSRLRKSRLLSEEEIAATANSAAFERSSCELGEQFVAGKKLTPFQAKTLLDGSDEPLTLGDYIVQDFVGRGGMGTVFRAIHRRMKRTVAIKVLRRDTANADVMAKRFLREVEVAAKLNHPNIVTAYDAGEQNGFSYLVSEFVEGQNLSDLVKEYGPLSLPLAVDVVQQAARALEYAHREGVIHRDIKPSNLLIDDAGNVKLLDVGLARVNSPEASEADHSSDLTTTGMIMGTVDYMSPEQAQNTRLADERLDIYSLGCTLFFLITGRAPFAKGTGIERLLAHREQPIPSLCQLSPQVPESLDHLLSSLMAKKPADRMATMKELVQRIEVLKISGLPDMTLPLGAADDGDSDWSRPLTVPPASADEQTQKMAPALADGSADVNSATELMPKFEAEDVEETIASISARRRANSSTSFLPWVILPGIAAVAVAAFFFIGPSKPPNPGPETAPDIQPENDEIAVLTDLSESDVKAYRAAWAARLGVSETVTVQGVSFVFIPPGDFLFGGERIESAVNSGYYLSETEITVGQFKVFADAEQFQTEAERDPDGGWGQDPALRNQKRWIRSHDFHWNNAGAQFLTPQHPVTNLAYTDMVAFCNWMSDETHRRVRLPTEIEWEYASRCGRRGLWSFGDEPRQLEEFAWYEGNSQQDMHSTRTRKPNAWGLFDMHGNEFERCLAEDGQDYDPSSTGPIRGGNIFSSAEETTSAFRKLSPLNTPTEGAFRVLMEL